MAKRRKSTKLGFVDYCRVDDNGKVHCYGKPIPESKRRPRRIGLEKGGQSGRKTIDDDDWGGPVGSNFFTSTSKVHAPSWSMGMGSSCPVIRAPVADLVQKMAERKKPMSNKEVIAKLENKIPEKCLACYAMGDNYPKLQTQQAMARRKEWFDTTNDKAVEDTLVDAISKAGDEDCSKATGECTFTPMTQPKRFRLFDSGDFTDAREVRIWRNVMKRLPGTKFWAPTTAWQAPCIEGIREKKEHKKMMDELKKMNSLKNAVVRPSATAIGSPAPGSVTGGPKGLTVGSAVVEKDYVEKKAGKPLEEVEGKFVEICQTKPNGSEGSCAKHYICPGNCGTCKACWGSKHPIAYVRHGLKPEKQNILTIFNRTVGTHTPAASFDPKSFAKTNKLIQRQFVRWMDIGPWGGKRPVMKLPKLKTHTKAEVAKMQADILWSRTKSPKEAREIIMKKVREKKLPQGRADAALKLFHEKVAKARKRARRKVRR